MKAPIDTNTKIVPKKIFGEPAYGVIREGGNAAPVANMTIQSVSAAVAQSPAARKNGRKPWVRNTGVPRTATPMTALLIARRRSPPAPLVRRG